MEPKKKLPRSRRQRINRDKSVSLYYDVAGINNNKRHRTMTTTTPIDAEALELYIDNEYDLYHDLWTPITTELTKQKKNGTYNREDALTAYMYLIRAGVRKYSREFPGTVTNPAAMIETAESMRDRFEIEHSLGNYEYLIEEPTDRQKEFIEMCYKIGRNNHYCSGTADSYDGLLSEEDCLNRNSFKVYTDLEELKETLSHSNWCLGTSCIYNDLCFINQISGGGEWLTIKRFGDEAIAFESMSMALICKDGNFEKTISRLEAATKEQCQTLTW